MYRYHARVLRVVDGDTLDLLTDLGFSIKVEMRVRLHGVDTPEVYGVKKTSEEYKKGAAATKFVVDWLDAIGNEITIQTHQDKQGKYGRYLVKVINEETGECLNEALVTNGHAIEVLYD